MVAAWATGTPAGQERWQRAHIESLPTEIKAEATSWERSCGGPIAATQMFSRPLEISGTRFLALHFEELQCPKRSAVCSGDGCRHEMYVFADGRFRRVLRLQTIEITLKSLNEKATLEIECSAVGCSRSLQWNGASFVEIRPSHVDTEHIFGFTEGADIGAKGEKELETMFTGRFGKVGQYHGLENETAFRYGVADGFRVSAALLTAYHYISNEPGLPDRNSAGFKGLQSYEVPAAILMDIAVVPDQLFAAINLTYTPMMERIGTGWQNQSSFEVSGAQTGALGPGMFVGVETRYAAAYDGSFLNRIEGHALFVGPSLFLVIGENMTFKAAWSRQVSGRASGQTGDLDLTKFEHNQVRVQLVKGF